MPVASFAPEFLALFRHGADEIVEVNGLTRAQAHTLQSRLHACRVAMRKEKHPLVSVADRVTISRRKADPSLDDEESTWSIIARPPDLDFAKRIRDAGVSVDAGQDVAPVPVAPTPDAALGDADATSKAVLDFINANPEGEKDAD